jgi:glycosyltransferase involved in cell wall biosynthesis
MSAHRIAFVVGTLTMGGSTTYLFNLAKGLQAGGIPCTVVCDNDIHPMAEDFLAAGIPVVTIGRQRSIYEDRMALVVRHLAEFRPTVQIGVLGHFSFDSLRYAPPGVFRIGMVLSDDPLVYRTHRVFASTMDGVVGNSKTIVERLDAMPEFRHTHNIYVPSAIPIPPVYGRDWNGNRALEILFLGRIYREQKRVHLFPNICTALQSSGIPFHWTIAGDGPELGFLKSAMRDAENEGIVTFTGEVPYRKIPELFKAHDIFLMTSDYEGLPMSLVEAMAYGMVPVVTDLESGMCEVVDETNGILVPPGSPTNYANAIIDLHSNRDTLASLSTSASQRIRSGYTVETMAESFLRSLPVSSGKIVWDNRQKIYAPRLIENRLQFRLPLRGVRRLMARLFKRKR